LLAILSLGEKSSGDMFFSSELDLLNFLSGQVGISVENIMLIERERDSAKMLADVQARAKYVDVLEATNKELKIINAELTKTQAQLVQTSRLTAIGELAGGVAHEVNNPLTGVLGNAQLLKLKVQMKPEAKIADHMKIVEAIETSASRCSVIIRGLLEFSRNKNKSPQISDLNALLKSTLILIDHMLEVDGIKIELALSEKPVLAMCNPGQIQQVFLNLISNSRWAIKQKSKNGVIQIKTFISDDGNSAIITFKDDGIGMLEKDMPRLFEPFFTTKPSGEGVGLGLSISWGIIQEHKGNIKVESKFNEFALFKIELPLHKLSADGA
jgi:signal transduction histidine kinase